jgi:hypothetical protein
VVGAKSSKENLMKKFFLLSAVLGLATAPALAGDNGMGCMRAHEVTAEATIRTPYPESLVVAYVPAQAIETAKVTTG